MTRAVPGGRHVPPRGAARRWRLVAAAAAVVTVLAGAGCTADKPAWRNGDGASPAVQEPPKATAAISEPVADAQDAEPLQKISFSTANADKAQVEVKDAEGRSVEGTTAPDGRSWQPAKALAWGGSYTATVTATGAGGVTGTATTRFTVKGKPDTVVRVSSFLADRRTVGVGMPMILKLDRAVPKDLRDDVQRGLTLESTPAQEGAWAWYNDKELHYRPKEFWQAGTKIKYGVRLTGVPLGDGWYGQGDWNVDVEIGRALVMTVDSNTKKMTVTRDGQQVRTIPVSLGKPKTPSSTGTMVIMEKQEKTRFNTMDEPDPANRYETDIDFAQRLTYGGEFIHAAPWSEGKQGRENVSHGCVNVSMKDGEWLFRQTMQGDPITVENTERPLNYGNGWTDWNKSWDEYVKGSAL